MYKKNSAIITYLNRLCGQVFKLLPMKEDYDQGADNYLYEYLEYLKSNFDGAITRYTSLEGMECIIEVGNNISFLCSQENVSFSKWRSIVLRSTRLINLAISELKKEVPI